MWKDHNATSGFQLNNPYKPGKFKLSLYKNQRGVILTYKDVEFIMEDPLAKEYYEWQKGMLQTEESFYATLLHLNVTPDTKDISSEDHSSWNEKHHKVKLIFAEWMYLQRDEERCAGKVIQDVCNFASKDLPRLHDMGKYYLFVNKFNLNVDSAAPLLHYKHIMIESLKNVTDMTWNCAIKLLGAMDILVAKANNKDG